MFRFGVLDDVDEHLPYRMKQQYFHVFRKLLGVPVVVKFNPEPVLVLHPFGQPSDGGLEAELVEDRRAEFKGQRLRVGDRLIDEVAEVAEELLVGIGESGFLEAADLHLAERKGLPDDIVQIRSEE